MDTFCSSVKSYEESSLELPTFLFVNSPVDLMTRIGGFGSPIPLGVGSSLTPSIVGKSQQLHSPQLIILSVQIVKEIHILQTDDLVQKPSNGLILLISLFLNFCSSCERNSHPAEKMFLYKNRPTASFFASLFSIFVQSCETHTTLQTNFLVWRHNNKSLIILTLWFSYFVQQAKFTQPCSQIFSVKTQQNLDSSHPIIPGVSGCDTSFSKASKNRNLDHHRKTPSNQAWLHHWFLYSQLLIIIEFSIVI